MRNLLGFKPQKKAIRIFQDPASCLPLSYSGCSNRSLLLRDVAVHVSLGVDVEDRHGPVKQLQQVEHVHNWVGIGEVQLLHNLAVKPLKVGVECVLDWVGVDEVQLLHNLAVMPLEVGVERVLDWVGIEEVQLHHDLACKHLKVGVEHVHDWLGVDEVLLHYLAIKQLGDVLTVWTVDMDRKKLLRAFGRKTLREVW